MPQTNKMEYRMLTYPLIAQEQNKRIDSDYYVEGYATTFDSPYVLWEYDGVKYYEVIDRNALAEADISDVIMQFDHRGKVLARQSNSTLGIEPNEIGLFIFADLSKSSAAKELYEEISSGLITKMSWGFTVSEESYNKDTRTWTILKIKKIYDVSAVSLPANDNTEIAARSYDYVRISKQKKRRLDLLKLKLSLEE